MIRHMKLSRMLVSTLAILAASSCLAAASTLSKAVRTSDSLEPALVHSDQAAGGAEQSSTRSSPGPASGRTSSGSSIDDMGYGDPGAYGGGAAIGRGDARTWTGWPRRA